MDYFDLLICRENKAWILHVSHPLAGYRVVFIFKAWAKFEMSLVANFQCRFKGLTRSIQYLKNAQLHQSDMAIARTMFRRSFKRLCICLLICTAFYVINHNLDLVQGNTHQREDATYHGEGATDPCQNMSVRLSDVPLPVTGIVSYPGAGNTWTRYLLQKVSG